MNDIIAELKIKSKKRLKAIKAEGDTSVHQQKLKDCQVYWSQQMGFTSWKQMTDYFSGELPLDSTVSHGTLWYSPACVALTNHWCSSYEEAAELKADNSALFLLPYKKQCMVVSSEFLTLLGFDHSDLDKCRKMKNDFVNGYGSKEWQALTLKRIKTGFPI